jgi:adenylate cyclase
MPAAPWFTRDPSIERPFVAADIPLARAGSKQQTDYLAVPKFKALALAPTGNFSFYSNVSNHEEASRRALERCGYLGGLACMVIALDDTFVVPIPTLAKVVGLYQSDALTAVAPALKDDVARRLKNAASGWKAVAVGASGQVGIKLGAESEQAAVDGSLEACRGQDRDCRLVVIGPFLVQRVP